MGSLPHSLWPHDVVVWVHSSEHTTTTPDPPGEYDERGGSRPQDVWVSLRPDSQLPSTLRGRGDNGQRAVQPRAGQSSQRSYDEPTRLKTTVCPGGPDVEGEVRRRTDRKTMDADRQTDRQTMVTRCRQPHSTTNHTTPHPHHAPPTPRPTHTTPHPHLMGGHQGVEDTVPHT